MGVSSCDRVKVSSGWQFGRLVNTKGFRIRLPGFIAVLPWTGYLAPLRFSLHIYKKVIIKFLLWKSLSFIMET